MRFTVISTLASITSLRISSVGFVLTLRQYMIASRNNGKPPCVLSDCGVITPTSQSGPLSHSLRRGRLLGSSHRVPT